MNWPRGHHDHNFFFPQLNWTLDEREPYIRSGILTGTLHYRHGQAMETPQGGSDVGRE